MPENANDSPCTARHLNHVCIAVNDIEATLEFYKSTFGTRDTEIEDIEDQAVRAALVRVGGSQIEFIQPTDPDGGVAKFIERRGEGVHHICFEVEDL
ncbi:MAG: VOC family protein, partial [Chloroflexi bacterium]|nr:VOC family protein [Chloroflexota bacterium]